LKIFRISSLLIFLSLSSCTHIRYVTKNTIPLAINKYELHQDHFEILGERDFYLWGKLPADPHFVDVEQEVMKKGFSAASSIYIEEFQSPGNWFITLLTFGLYMPVDYSIRGVGVKPSGN
jgi:hypothetical protein